MAEGDEAVGSLSGADRVDGCSDTTRVDVEARPGEPPALGRHAPEQDPQEAQSRLVRAAHPVEAHHRVGRPQQGLEPGGLGGHGHHSLTHTRWMWM